MDNPTPIKKEEENIIDIVRWYPLRAYKTEFKTEQALKSFHDISFFLAKRYIKTTRHGKPTRMLVPSIPSLIFVRGSLRQINQIKETIPHLQYLWRNRTHSSERVRIFVPDNQMNNFIQVASQTEAETTYYRPGEINLDAGKRVKIHGGLLDGCEGILVRPKGKRSRHFVVSIESLGSMAVEVSPDLIEIL